jgi:hypothetical protein
MRGNEGHGSQSIIELGYEINSFINLDNHFTYFIKHADPSINHTTIYHTKMKRAYSSLTPRITPRCLQNPLQVLMTFPIINLLVQFKIRKLLNTRYLTKFDFLLFPMCFPFLFMFPSFPSFLNILDLPLSPFHLGLKLVGVEINPLFPFSLFS